MDDRTLSQNLLLAYIQIKAANESLKMIMEFKSKIKNTEMLDLIKQVKPKLSYFTKVIDETLLSDPSFNEKHFRELEEKCFESLDLIDEFVKCS